MVSRKSLRVANGIVWLWVWLSSVMLPVTSGTDHYWAAKGAQLFTLNPNIQDIPRFIGNAVFPLILWYIVDRSLKPKAAKT